MVENAIIGSGYGRMRDQIMVEKHRQVVDSTLGQDQVMVELTGWLHVDLKTRLNQNPNKDDSDRLGSRKKPKPRLKLSPHDLRRTAVTRALSLGFTYRQVRSMTGHEDIRMVVKYDHERGNLEENAINFLHYDEN
jgi:integrase